MSLYRSATLQRRSAMTVEQLAHALGATLDLSSLAPALQPSEAMDPAEQAQAELGYAMQRLRLIDHVTGIGQAAASSLVFAEDQKSFAAAAASDAGAILLPAALAQPRPAGDTTQRAALLLVAQPRLQFSRAARLLRAPESPSGVHSTALISAAASLGARVSVGPFAVVEQGAVIGQGTSVGAGAIIGAGASIGAECRIYPRVVVYAGSRLGDRVVVHAGAVLGADGFGYVRDETTGAYLQFPQQGTLVIEDDVDIGANTTIDRGALGETRVARGAKLDNQVHVGHNVQIGEDAILAGQVGISGSSRIGRGAILGGQVGIGDHAEVGEGVIIGGQGGVLPHKILRGPGELFWSTPARPVKQYLRELALMGRAARRTPSAGGRDEGK